MLTACRSCASRRLTAVVSLGETPLANAIVTEEQLGEREPRYPLTLLLCAECSLLQLSVTVPPEETFATYPYFSSVSSAMRQHASDWATDLIKAERLGTESLVVEIGSNDGYMLRNFAAARIPVLGIEPARNVAAVAEAEGIPTVAKFFSRSLVSSMGRADLVIANNVMAHMPDINDVVAGVAELLKPEGTFVMETPYAASMIEGLQFDTIYHEHVFYYSLTALRRLLERHGLLITDVEHVAIHGGSLRVTATHAEEAQCRSSSKRAAFVWFLDHEMRGRVSDPAAYKPFAARIVDLVGALGTMLVELHRLGAHLVAYGAAAKGVMLLHALGDAAGVLEYVVDKSPHKRGRYMPGSRLLIAGPERLLEEPRPDYALLLTWNFEQEIVAEQSEYLRRGGRFLVPIPHPRVVGQPSLRSLSA